MTSLAELEDISIQPQQTQQPQYMPNRYEQHAPDWSPQGGSGFGLDRRGNQEGQRELKQRQIYQQQQQQQMPNEVVIKKQDNNKQNILHKVPKILREPLLIIILFFILSTSAARNAIGNYIPAINPDSSGSVSYIGILIYGIILAIAYSSIKYLLELLS